MSETSREERLLLARRYVEQLENAQDAEADETLWQLVAAEGKQLEGVGELTPELRDALGVIGGLIMAPRLGEITRHELPDAKERLNYVISMTEKAADSTLSAIEFSRPAMEQLGAEAAELAREWQRFRARELRVEDFRELSQRLATFLEDLERQAGMVQDNLSEILMAQSYQDLTGQVVKRVSVLVHDLEQHLGELLEVSVSAFPPVKSASSEQEEDMGPLVPGLNDQGRVHGQDEVDDLLSELGL